MKKKIIVTDRFSLESLMTIENHPQFEIIKMTADPTFDQHQPEKSEIFEHHLKDAYALLIRSKTKIDSALLAKAKKLQLIITATSGFDHIDLESTQKWGITVMNTPNANRESAAQLTLSLILNCAHKFTLASKSLRQGDWRKDDFIGKELKNHTLGIVGLGRIGSRVAELARIFGMQILAYDPYLDGDIFTSLNINRVSFDELLKLSDFITFHVPKTAETYKMLNRSQLEYINRGAYIINTSRSTVIDEDSIIEALEKKWISGLALDVFDKEPISKQSRFLNFPEVILTPHIGAFTEDAFFKASEDAIMKLIQFVVDGSTQDTLPPRASWYGATHFRFDL